MPVLVDLTHSLISNLMQEIASHPEAEIKMDLFRHMALNSIRSYRVKFREYAESPADFILCCDGGNYWRKDSFKHYKEDRKKIRGKSPFDWNQIFTCINQLIDELDKNFPYKVLRIARCEADDIIAVLTKKFAGEGKPVMIVSGDKDFQQLQKYPNVRQYRPVQKDYPKCKSPKLFLVEHIMQAGDDGIPNFLSDGDTFVTDGKRQKPLAVKKIQAWICEDPLNPIAVAANGWTESMVAGYQRNQLLIDFDLIPKQFQEEIINTYTEKKCGNKQLLYNYFVACRLKELLSRLNEF
jgi:hypothetical protein